MNRVIKFRAWDTFHNKFVYSGDEEGALSNFFAKVAGGEAAKREVPVMQFTGLTDKNGVEIYEGDILDMKGHKHEVLWNEKLSCWSVSDHILLNRHKLSDYTHKGEVIGNVYENPELL